MGEELRSRGWHSLVLSSGSFLPWHCLCRGQGLGTRVPDRCGQGLKRLICELQRE